MNLSGRDLELNVGEGGFPSPVRVGNIVRVKKHFCHTLRCVLTRNYSVIAKLCRGAQCACGRAINDARTEPKQWMLSTFLLLQTVLSAVIGPNTDRSSLVVRQAGLMHLSVIYLDVYHDTI